MGTHMFNDVPKVLTFLAVFIAALAFGGGLALAWFGGWQTKDLVWSLWLSSLLVGYAMIVWMIFSPALFIATNAWRDRALIGSQPVAPAAAGGALLMVGGLFLLAFFTVHFGMFHFVHSVFLNLFFPVVAGKAQTPGLGLYLQVLAAYWPFVLVAAVAERKAFRWPGAAVSVPEPDTAVTPEAIAARKMRQILVDHARKRPRLNRLPIRSRVGPVRLHCFDSSSSAFTSASTSTVTCCAAARSAFR